MEKQIACILGPDSGCDEVGLKAKRIGPLVLSDHCPRPMCDECTRRRYGWWWAGCRDTTP